MTPAVPAPAPLEASDIQRVGALKAKIGDRISDVRELAELRGRRDETKAGAISMRCGAPE
jgi:hypothetical protein